MAATLVACGGSDDTTASPGTGAGTSDAARPAGAPVSGGTLTIGLNADPLGVDGAVVTSIWRNITRALTDSLIFLNPDTLELEPWLATSWEVSDDARTFRLTLRDDVVFNDGTELTSAVVKANFESLQRPGMHSSSRAVVAGIQDIRTPSDDVIEVEFAEPNASFLETITGARVGIVSEATARSEVSERQYFLDGSGPYKLVDYVDGSQIVLERRDDYNWAPEWFDHQGPAYIDRIVYKVILEDSARRGALEKGEIQFAASIDSLYLDQLKAAGLQVKTDARNPGTGTEWPLNTRSPFLGDVRVRRALNLGIDREQLSKVNTPGVDTRPLSILSRDNPYFTDRSDLLAHDPDRAVELLEEAGWGEVGSDGIRRKDGQRLSLRFPGEGKLQEIVKDQWARIGVELVLDPPLAAEANEKLLSGEYDVNYWYHSYPSGDVLRANYGVTTGSNRSFIEAGTELDRLLDEQNSILDPAERQVVIDRIVEILLGDAYTLAMVSDVDVWAYAPNLHGLKNSGVDQLLYDAWFSED